MELKDFLVAMEHIETDIAQVIGAIKATIYKQKQNAKEDNCGVKFTQQEVNLMPKAFRKEFRVDGCTARIRKKQNSKKSFSYEIRYRRNGYNVCASAPSVEEAKRKFIEKLKRAEKMQGLPATSSKFEDFAQRFFEDYYVEKVAPSTFTNVQSIYKRWVLPTFAGRDITKITPTECKRLLDDIKAKGFAKTTDDVHTVLNQIFKYALAYGILQRNPLAIIPYKQHERVNGKRLTPEEERLLLDKSAPKFKCFFAIYLYCGIRPGELNTVRIEEPFIVCQNTKQKGQKYAEKKIPITHNLRRYLDEQFLTEIPSINHIRVQFRAILPNHSLKDCRRTFNSRCKERGVNEDVRKLFMGHSLGGKIALAYTEFTDEFLLAEAQKLND